MEEPDTVIVVAVLQGDVAAFEIIINRYNDAFRRYVYRLGITPPHDDDMLQTIFLKIYKNLNNFNPSYVFSSWAYRIAHNEAVSHTRKKRWLHTFQNDEEKGRFWDGVLDESSAISLLIDEENSAIREDAKKHLSTAIHMLDRKYADPLILHYFENKQYKDISDILRIPSSTVGTRIRRAKEKIRHLLSDMDV